MPAGGDGYTLVECFLWGPCDHWEQIRKALHTILKNRW